MFCPQHHGKELELYCETHGQMVRHNSTINGRHEYCKLVVVDSYNRLKAEISATLQPVEKQLSAINSALDEIDQRSKELNDKRIATEANILQKLKQLQKLLDTREAELITQLNQVTQEKLKNFASHWKESNQSRSFTSNATGKLFDVREREPVDYRPWHIMLAYI